MTNTTRPDKVQPAPRLTLVSRMEIDGHTVTAIARLWNPGEYRRCSLCLECSADRVHSACQVVVNAAVEPGDAAFFSLTKFLGGGVASAPGRDIGLSLYTEGLSLFSGE